MENQQFTKEQIDKNINSRFGHTITLVSKGKDKAKAILFGGAIGSDGHFSITADTYAYYIHSQQWFKLKRNNIYN